ncbi:hypothetical protein ACFQH6_15950 [Halobacteriaceae archaeon GCM10025711]
MTSLVQPLAAGPADTVAVTRALAYLVIAVASTILLYYLYTYVRFVLAEPYRHRWWYLGVGIAAGVVYGVSGLLDVLTPWEWPALFVEGAALFFILFLALGMRAMYFMGRGGDGEDQSVLPAWADYLVIGAFIVAWWTGFLTAQHAWIAGVQAVGWILATAWALFYAVRAVRKHEGTSIAALVRHLMPALLSFTVIVGAELLAQFTTDYDTLVTAALIVGTVLVGAFLFTTAVAIRQQGGEVERMYDWTTWRG